MPNKLRVIKPLVIGLGVAGQRHLEAQLKLGFQVGVYSLNLKKDDPLSKQGNVIIFDNLEQAIDWSNLVHVCTPDDLHTEFVASALKKGRAVLCEKSFTTNLKDALSLQKLAHEANCLLTVGQNYRLTPTFAETRNMILDGDLGSLRSVKTTYLHDKDQYQQRKPSRKNQDFLYIAGSHAVDLACWVVNQQITKVQATSKNELNYHISVEFSSGLLGEIELDANSQRKISGIDLIVEGNRGKLVSHIKSDKLQLLKTGEKNPQVVQLPNNQTLTTTLEVKIIDEYLLGKQNSYQPLPDVDEAVNTVRILSAISRSTHSGKSELV